MAFLNVKYSIDEKLAYPKWALELYKDNFFRCLIYIIIYVALRFNLVLAILIINMVITLHIDYINFIKI